MRIAALDLGSNSFHLLVADVHPDGTSSRSSARRRCCASATSWAATAGSRRAADARSRPSRRFRQLADARGRGSDRQGHERDPHRRQRRRGRRPHRGRDRRRGRGDQRPREARLIFGRSGQRRARAGARAVLRPRRRQRRDHGRRHRRPALGDERAPRRRPAHRRASSTATRCRRRIARGSRHTSARARPVVDEVAALEPRLVVGSSGTLKDLARMVVGRATTPRSRPSTNGCAIERRALPRCTSGSC